VTLKKGEGRKISIIAKEKVLLREPEAEEKKGEEDKDPRKKVPREIGPQGKNPRKYGEQKVFCTVGRENQQKRREN